MAGPYRNYLQLAQAGLPYDEEQFMPMPNGPAVRPGLRAARMSNRARNHDILGTRLADTDPSEAIPARLDGQNMFSPEDPSAVRQMTERDVLRSVTNPTIRRKVTNALSALVGGKYPPRLNNYKSIKRNEDGSFTVDGMIMTPEAFAAAYNETGDANPLKPDRGGDADIYDIELLGRLMGRNPYMPFGSKLGDEYASFNNGPDDAPTYTARARAGMRGYKSTGW